MFLKSSADKGQIMKKIKVIQLILLIIVGAVIYQGCSSQNDEIKINDAIPVKTKNIALEEISIPIHTSGKLHSTAEIKLSFKVGGIIDNIYVNEGQAVKKGQLLARLKLDEINAQAVRARSGFEKAQRDYQRAKNLYADSVATLEQIEDAETGLDIARSNLKIAEFNLKHAAIYAPTKGKILKRFPEQSEMAAPGNPVFIFGSSNKEWIARAGVIDSDIIRLKIGDSASVSFDAYPEISFPARVAEIAESADPLNGTYEVELTVSPNKNKLVSGFTAKIDIFPAKKQPCYIIPAEALVEADANEGYIYVINTSNNTAKKVNVKIGYIFDDGIAIASGLTDIQAVIASGASYLTDGSAIKIVN
ncbi:MAG: efflux RND transporter periplasmic adaptor subunit [candidate division Zixibacteria bacterium]|nr:efflux RND transporter periplasmic adaptor subunit [candidate division Zixibacteria bacterium]